MTLCFDVMPASSLFGVSFDGRVYVLSTTGTRWHELDYLGIEFKHVSAVPNCVWAVGGDRQIYLHVHGLDIPIRVKEESYENQRWLPFSSGFSSRLLPTDRYQYSNEDGTIDRSQNKIELPSRAWAWESDWQIELVMDDGQPLDQEGWMYAVDFPANYTPQKHFNSFVRRRKWYRYRRYVALNSWCALPPLHRDPTQEPFIDVSVGGHQISSCEAGVLCVWAITVQGRLLFRSGISAVSPEGSHWAGIPLLQRCEPAQLCVGPYGHVWCVLWDGRVLVRDRISREQLQGEQWIEISPPEQDGVTLKLKQVAVGANVAWAVTNDGAVWFRRGISIPGRPAGSSWLPMIGDMAQVSVGANDQVWAVGSDDRNIYFRTGILPEEMTGRTWRKVQVGVRKIRTHRNSIASSADSSSGINLSGSPNRHHVHHLGTSATIEKPTDSFIHRSPRMTTSSQPSIAATVGDALNTELANSLDNLTMQDNQAADISALLTGDQQEGACSSLPTNYVATNKQLQNMRDGSHSMTQLETGKLSGTDSETDSVFGEDDEMFMSDFMPRLIHETDDLGQQSWNWVAAGACTVDPMFPPTHWFTDAEQSKSSNIMTEPWRNKILEELKARNKTGLDEFDSYETAIETNSWVKSGRAKAMLTSGGACEECVIELECVNSPGGEVGLAGTLSILSPDKAKTKTQLNLSELAVAMVTSEPGIPRLTLYESCNGARRMLNKGQQQVCRPILQLVFSCEKDMEDWQDNLNKVCCKLQSVSEAFEPGSIWATTLLGDVFVWDPSTVKCRQTSEDGIYRKELASFPQQLPCEAQLSNAFPLGSALEITGRPHSKADRFAINIQSFWGHVIDSSKYIALHFNPRFKDECVIRNSMDSGVWGMEERDGELPFECEVEFRLRIECHTDCFMIFVNGEEFTTYAHRLRPEHMGFVAITGAVSISSIIYETKELALAPTEMFWRQIGGHLHKVETCDSGIVWGLGFDGRAWVFTGGWGGGCFGASDASNTAIYPMSDTQSYYIYENQRWNPLTGYSARGLPTDRPTWSDKTGKQKCSKDRIRLRSMHWTWLSDWRVDFHVSGGVDKEGWQYAVDFPASYHGRKKFTDYVRRRRWERKCTINTSGPWMELGGTKLLDISLRSDKGVTTVWAVAANGDALYRCGISKECPQGERWEHITCEQPLSCISLGRDNKLWAVGKKGAAFWRFDITPTCPTGKAWIAVEPPSSLQQISVDHDVWALDKEGKIYLRREITSFYPEGTHWLMATDMPDTNSRSVRQISCGPSGLWAVLGSGDEPGAIGLRCGITDKASSGIAWNLATSTGWLHISARSNWISEQLEKN